MDGRREAFFGEKNVSLGMSNRMRVTLVGRCSVKEVPLNALNESVTKRDEWKARTTQ